MRDVRLISLNRSKKATKKYVALFEVDGKLKAVHFGASGFEDYTTHRDAKRKASYLARHAARENWADPLSAGALSRWVLWNKTSLEASLADYLKRFKIR